MSTLIAGPWKPRVYEIRPDATLRADPVEVCGDNGMLPALATVEYSIAAMPTNTPTDAGVVMALPTLRCSTSARVSKMRCCGSRRTASDPLKPNGSESNISTAPKNDPKRPLWPSDEPPPRTVTASESQRSSGSVRIASSSPMRLRSLS